MAVERLPNPITFIFPIKTQHHSCDFAPARTFCTHLARRESIYAAERRVRTSAFWQRDRSGNIRM